jgi:hypothetical protein
LFQNFSKIFHAFLKYLKILYMCLRNNSWI